MFTWVDGMGLICFHSQSCHIVTLECSMMPGNQAPMFPCSGDHHQTTKGFTHHPPPTWKAQCLAHLSNTDKCLYCSQALNIESCDRVHVILFLSPFSLLLSFSFSASLYFFFSFHFLGYFYQFFRQKDSLFMSFFFPIQNKEMLLPKRTFLMYVCLCFWHILHCQYAR